MVRLFASYKSNKKVFVKKMLFLLSLRFTSGKICAVSKNVLLVFTRCPTRTLLKYLCLHQQKKATLISGIGKHGNFTLETCSCISAIFQGIVTADTIFALKIW